MPKLASALFAALLASCVLCAAETAQAQTSEMTPALAKIVAAAKSEGRLDLRSTNTVLGGPAGAKLAQEGIKRMFGVDIPVAWSPGPAFGPLAAQIYQEMQAGQPSSTDVYTTTAPIVVPYLDKGLLKPVDWAALMPSRIKPAIVEADGRALRFMTFLPGILYNMKVAPWVPEIKTLSDLLKPEYKGKFYTTPQVAILDSLLADDVWGKARTVEYMKELSQQIGGIVGCEGMDRIASGEIPALAIDCTGTAQNKAEYRGKGIIATQIVNDVAQTRYAYLTIPAHSVHPNAGILYALYVLSPEGQDRIVWDYFGGDLSDFPESHVRQEVVALEAKGTKFLDMTIAWSQNHPTVEKSARDLVRLIREH